MRSPTPAIAVALGLVLGWSTAQAAPARDTSRHKKAKKVKPPVEAAPPAPADHTADADDRTAATTDAKNVALETADARTDIIDERAASTDAATVVKVAVPPARNRWQVEIGPYLWASSVNANVSLGGPVSAGAEIGFIPLTRHARYGAELLGEVRYGRFAISGDLMYGVAGVEGSTSIASVMMTVNGSASSLLIDGAASYQVIGDQDARFTLEARGGVRYQRTAVDGELDVVGVMVQVANLVDDGADATLGTRAVVRPAPWLSFSGMFDVGVVGASDSTWSASADASLRVSSHVLVSAGWRTLTMERSRVSLTLQGPRAAVQLVF